MTPKLVRCNVRIRVGEDLRPAIAVFNSPFDVGQMRPQFFLVEGIAPDGGTSGKLLAAAGEVIYAFTLTPGKSSVSIDMED